MALYRFFKPVVKPIEEQVKPTLPSPDGDLSLIVPSSSIEAANKKVAEVIEANACSTTSKRATYIKYSASDRATIGNYAVQHGTSAAVKHFNKDFPNLNWSTVNDWKKSVVSQVKSNHAKGKDGRVVELIPKKRGRPSLLSEELTKDLMAYIRALREVGGTVNTAIVMSAAMGMIQQRDPTSLACNGGHITLEKNWAKYFLEKMSFVKRKGTTKSKVTVEHFEEVKQQYLLDIKAVVEMEEIPDELIINWDQTGINYVPMSQWTMAEKGSKRVQIVGLNDKRQITALFGGSLPGDFLPIQLVYQGKTGKCLPKVDFPTSWHVTSTPNHWCNEATMKSYLEVILVPYVQEKRTALGLPGTQPALVIFDEFKGQFTDEILMQLEENNIFYVVVPANCTDRLQPLDVSVNRPAKEFLRSKFGEWYAEKVAMQMKDAGSVTPIDLKLSEMKPIGARWMMELYDYFKAKPEIIINGFKAAGILNILKS
uniref:DDE-1 domain-containing protein n=1 Tax=Amphimedon queenslandica TaxID=400682 RepID=A0A1X7UUQ0_AMPQE